MGEITIKSAVLTGGYGLRITHTMKEKDGSITETTQDRSSPVHDDLRNAFNRFNVHIALIAEQIPKDSITDIEKPEHEMLEDFKVSAFEIVGDDEGVKLKGSRKLSTGKTMPLAPPSVKWEERESKSYLYSDTLAESVEMAKHEINAYLDGKHAPEAQQQLPFGDDDEAI